MSGEQDIRVRTAGMRDYARALPAIEDAFVFHLKGAPDLFQPIDVPPPDRASVSDVLDTGGAFLIAEVGGEVVGFAIVEIVPAANFPYAVPRSRASIDTIGVRTPWRRQGVGRKLVAYAEGWSRRHGCDDLDLHVYEFNQGAIAFYEAMGFGTVDRRMRKALR